MPRQFGSAWKIDISGKSFNSWLVVSRIAGSMWLCRCKCGIEKPVSGSSLTMGKSKCCASCGNRRHGMEGSKVYNTWAAMKQRCLNPVNKVYQSYGGRGINVCSEWLIFEQFFLDMGIPPKGASIGRVDNDGNYEPSNCRWETPVQQSRNRRTTNMAMYEGKMQSVAKLAEEFGHTARNVGERLKAGWSIDDALRKPNRKSK